MAGHSLGEYTALVASGALSFADALPLVRYRAEVMQSAVPAGVGAMAAILGLDDETVRAVCAEAAQGEVVEAVNLNSPGQVVIAGNKAAVERGMITRGEGERGYAPPAVTTPTRVIIKSYLPKYAESNYTQGVALHVCNTRLNAQPKLAGIKHLNRLENVLARMEWKSEAIFDGLMLDASGNVIECTMSNIFARYGDDLITPDLSQCGVAGITRQQIIGHVRRRF